MSQSKILRVASWLLLWTMALSGSVASGQTRPYPKPQIASSEGKPAPDFTLNDQTGKAFKLSDQRGHWVLLFFYRGYW